MVTSHLGSVAQLVERSTENRKVTGSTPVGATTGKHQFFGTGAFLHLTAIGQPLFKCVPCPCPGGWPRSNCPAPASPPAHQPRHRHAKSKPTPLVACATHICVSIRNMGGAGECARHAQVGRPLGIVRARRHQDERPAAAWPAQQIACLVRKKSSRPETFDYCQTDVARARVGLRKRLHPTRR